MSKPAITIAYKGDLRTVPTIGNKVLMQFERQGGRLSELEQLPVTTAVTLICCALGLPGDPIDHADDLPSLKVIAQTVKAALEASGLTGDEDEPGEQSGS